jgi:hypothetical protein
MVGRDHQRGVRGADLEALLDHDAGLGPLVAVLLGHHAGDDAAVAGQGLVHEVELVGEVGLLERLPVGDVAAAAAGLDQRNGNGQPDDRGQCHHPTANRPQLGPLGQDEPSHRDPSATATAS